MTKERKKQKPPLTAARAAYLLKARVQELPFTSLFDWFHEHFSHIRTEGLLKAVSHGLFAYQLAALVKYIIVYGVHRKKRPRYDLAPYINAGKDLWWAVIGADEEKELGYTSKNVDWTVLLGNAGLLFECKSSALFSPGKVLATPDAVSKDLAKNLVGEGKGLFQLHHKLQAIKKGDLPPVLKERYENITTWYPIVILYDQIQDTNARQVLRNLLDAALRKASITNFDYQIWHVEELENLLELVSEADLVSRIRGKWEHPKMFEWDLNIYLHSLFGLEKLKATIFVPEKDSTAYKILKELAD